MSCAYYEECIITHNDELMYVWDKTHATNNNCYYDKIDFTVHEMPTSEKKSVRLAGLSHADLGMFSIHVYLLTRRALLDSLYSCCVRVSCPAVMRESPRFVPLGHHTGLINAALR